MKLRRMPGFLIVLACAAIVVTFVWRSELTSTGHEPLTTLTAPSRSWVLALAFSPDGKTLAAAADEGSVRLWEVPTGKLIHTFDSPARMSVMMSVVFAPDGNAIVTGSNECAVRIWRLGGTETSRKLSGHTNTINSVAFSPNGRLIASGSMDQTACLWDFETGNRLGRHMCLWGANCVAFSPDGSVLAVSSDDGVLRFLDVSDGRERRLEGPLHQGWSEGVAFSPNGRLVAASKYQGEVGVWAFPTLQPLVTIKASKGTILPKTLLFGPDGRTILWATPALHASSGAQWGLLDEPVSEADAYPAAVHFWDLLEGRETFRVDVPDLHALALSPDGNLLATSDDGVVSLWKVGHVWRRN